MKSGAMSISIRCAVLGILVLAAQHASADRPRYPVPKGAMEARHVRLADTGAGQDMLDVRLPYPSTQVLEHYRKVFGKWAECRHRSVWESFAQRSGPHPRFINQLLWHWVRADDQAIVTLVIRYYSNGDEYRAKPDSDIQHVILIENATPQARAAAAKLGATCEPPA